MHSLHTTDRIQTRARIPILLGLILILSLSTVFDARAAVVFKSFGAVQDGSTILVTWETATELYSIAFNLYRSESASGPWTKLVNQQPAQGDGVTGRKYRYSDADVEPDVRYYYYLKEVTQTGLGSEVGPVDARVELTTHRLYLPVVVR
jgi:hypothetical protein